MKILGVVIGGVDEPYSARQLRKLKRTDHGEKRFYTYDDMMGSLVSLLNDFKEL